MLSFKIFFDFFLQYFSWFWISHFFILMQNFHAWLRVRCFWADWSSGEVLLKHIRRETSMALLEPLAFIKTVPVYGMTSVNMRTGGLIFGCAIMASRLYLLLISESQCFDSRLRIELSDHILNGKSLTSIIFIYIICNHLKPVKKENIFYC